MHPLVSIIVPSFQQGRFIRETIESILAQDYRPLEVLVFDGGSTDGTVDVLRSFSAPELRWTSERDHGVVDAVNKGLAQASGWALAIQSSDDVYLPGAIRRAVSTLEADAGLGLVYGDVEYVDEHSKPVGGTNLPPFDLAGYAGKRMFIPQASAFFTRSAYEAVGGWREDVSYAADAEFFLRIATLFRVRKLDARLARYRYHEEQRDRTGSRVARDWEIAIRRWIGSETIPSTVRRSAIAGIHLTRAHYLSDDQWLRRSIELYRALLIDPRLVRNAEFPLRELIPGRTPIWKVLSRVKRALGFRPRQGNGA